MRRVELQSRRLWEISIADDDAYATLGIGGLLSVAGDFEATSSLENTVQTKAEGDTKSSNTGVGISIALTIVNDTSLATTGRDLVAAGTLAFMSSAISVSESNAKASVAGAQSKSNDSSGKDVDQKKQAQQDYADNTAKGGGTVTFDAGTAVDPGTETITLDISTH